MVSVPSPFTSPVRAASFLLPKFTIVRIGDFPTRLVVGFKYEYGITESVFGRDISLLPLDITLGVSVGFKYECGITESEFPERVRTVVSGLSPLFACLKAAVSFLLLEFTTFRIGDFSTRLVVGFKYEYGITESDPPERLLIIVSGPSPFTSPVRAASFLLPKFNIVTMGDFPKPPETLAVGSYFAASLAIPVLSFSGMRSILGKICIIGLPTASVVGSPENLFMNGSFNTDLYFLMNFFMFLVCSGFMGYFLIASFCFSI